MVLAGRAKRSITESEAKVKGKLKKAKVKGKR
jgi:hypothetical protein